MFCSRYWYIAFRFTWSIYHSPWSIEEVSRWRKCSGAGFPIESRIRYTPPFRCDLFFSALQYTFVVFYLSIAWFAPPIWFHWKKFLVSRFLIPFSVPIEEVNKIQKEFLHGKTDSEKKLATSISRIEKRLEDFVTEGGSERESLVSILDSHLSSFETRLSRSEKVYSQLRRVLDAIASTSVSSSSVHSSSTLSSAPTSVSGGRRWETDPSVRVDPPVPYSSVSIPVSDRFSTSQGFATTERFSQPSPFPSSNSQSMNSGIFEEFSYFLFLPTIFFFICLFPSICSGMLM